VSVRYGLGLDLKLMKRLGFDRSTGPINRSGCQPFEVCDSSTNVTLKLRPVLELTSTIQPTDAKGKTRQQLYCNRIL